MNILFISSYYLFEKTRFGGSKRLFLLAKELSRHADVSVICLDGCRELGEDARSAPPHPDFGHFLYLPWTDSRGLFKKLLSSGIIIEDLLAQHAETIHSFLSGKTYDAAFLAFSMSLSFIGTVIRPGSFPIVYCEDDLFLEKVRTEKPTGPLDSLYRFIRTKQLLAFYSKKIARCTAVTAISLQEKKIFNGYFPSAHVDILGYGIDLERYPFLDAARGARTLGFIGNFLHLPNTDALRWFLEKAYPVIKGAISGVRFAIAGHGLPDDLRHEHTADASILWLGEVEDLTTFYSGISVFVNPIVSGRGMRTKLIEAAAFGRPIVSTALGAEGAECFSVDVANDGASFAEKCLRLLSDTDYYAQCATKNRSVVERTCSISVVGKRLLDILSCDKAAVR